MENRAAARDLYSHPDNLPELLREATQRSPLVVAAYTHWQALRRMPIQAQTLPDPQIQLQEFTVGSAKPLAGYETSDFYYTGFGASQDIPGPGKLRIQGEIAEKEAEMAFHQYEAAQREAAEKVREHYYELFYLAKTLDLLERNQTDLANIEQIAEARYRVGEGQEQDVFKAQLQATQILDMIEHRHREMAQRQNSLKVALGRDLDSVDVEIRDIELSKPTIDSTQVIRMAEDGSPEIRMAAAAEQRSEKELSLAHQAYIPDFTVGYQYEKTGPGVRDYYMLTLGAKIPLYFWRKQTPAIEQAALETSAARVQKRARTLEASGSAADELIAIHASDRVLTLYRQGLIPQAENSLQAAIAGYRVAKIDFQSLISAFIDVLNLNQEYYREFADHEIAVAKLEQVVGDIK